MHATKNCLTSSLNYANEYKLNIQIEAAKKDVDLETHIEKDKDSYRWLKKKIHRTTARGKSMETNSFDHSGNEQHLSYHQGANLAKKVNHKKAKKNMSPLVRTKWYVMRYGISRNAHKYKWHCRSKKGSAGFELAAHGLWAPLLSSMVFGFRISENSKPHDKPRARGREVTSTQKTWFNTEASGCGHSIRLFPWELSTCTKKEEKEKATHTQRARSRVCRAGQISDFRLGSKQTGARIRTQNHPPQKQWAHSRRFESKAALKG